VYPVSSAQTESRPSERRRSPRHRASSIVYAQIGPDNGGIIINIGIDGVACQAARKMTAAKNAIFELRLRGSGLDTTLVGELVWLGASQKEVGISFQNPSPAVQQEIANWIAQQEQPSRTASSGEPSQPKPMPAMAAISAAGEKLVPRSLSAALAMSQASAIAADSPTGTQVHADDSSPAAPLDAAPATAANTPLPEIISPVQSPDVSADAPGNRAQVDDADSTALPVQSQVEQPAYSPPSSGLSPIEHPYPSPADHSSSIVLSEVVAPVRENLPQTLVKLPAKSELSKPKIAVAIPQAPVPAPAETPPKVTAAERWIPPALLAAWRQGDRQHRFLLAGTGSAFLLICVLVLALAVTLFEHSLHLFAGSESSQQSTVHSASIVRASSPEPDPQQGAPDPDAFDQPEANRPPPTPLERLGQLFWGTEPVKPQGPIIIEIDKDRVGVMVWTSKISGYYYCIDDPYYKTVQPGAFLTQRDALQNGYQPKLGQFCN
jgi:hypothetical protein